MRAVNLSSILSKYNKGWVALTPDNRKFLASATTLNRVLEKAKKRGVSNPTVFKPAKVKHLFAG